MTRNALLRLARAWGVQTAYYDVNRTRRHAHPDVLLAVLRTLGAPVLEHADVPEALREHEQARARPGIEPVHVAWNGALPPLRGRLPMDVTMTCRLELETGMVHEWAGRLRAYRDGNGESCWRTGLPLAIPLGYHTLELRARSAAFRTLIISAPRHAYRLPEPNGWGLFLPLYAVRSGRGGSADYTDLAALAQWTGALGGTLFGTLPLLATFLREPFEPSPYAPASRLFWSDFYIDIDRLPGSPPDARLEDARRGLVQCGRADVVDYRRIAALKRSIVDDAAQRFFRAPCETREELAAYVADRSAASPATNHVNQPRAADHSITRDYARFRAVCDRRREGWHAWPERMRDGDIREGDFDPRDERYHLYAAWVAERQLAAITAAATSSPLPNSHADSGRPGEGGSQQRVAALYLDLPLGVHHDGFDSWRWPDLFAIGVSAGAPPDTFFPGGQDWGFTPLVPSALRASGYRYFRDCLRHHAHLAGALRLDHVMALERLFFIPRGFGAEQGIYVRYPLDEMIAVLTLESVRHQTAIVGEDLGTVSRRIRAAMGRHGLHRMFVLQFETTPGDERLRPDVPRSAVASLNTHDMPPFATWRREHLSDSKSARRQPATPAREAETADRTASNVALRRALEGLAAGRARFVIVNLEDIWLETRPQNVPGSPSAHNWRRRARLTLEEMRSDPDVLGQLERVADAREQVKSHE